jgi:hypothetical protein
MIIYTQRLLPFFLTLIVILTVTVSCENQEDEDLVPSYIHIDKISVSSNLTQGSNSSNITDAWVYLDETLIGSFELPATVPILSSGKQKITVRPGIKLNGISNTRAAYPFYTGIVRELELVKDSIINITGNTSYERNTIFPWLEDFDSPSLSIDTSAKSDVSIAKTSDPQLIFNEPGNLYSGLVTMTNDTSIFEVVTKDKFDFPENGGYIFLEVNYKINHPLVFGVYYSVNGARIQRPIVILNKTDEWKKTYINLSVIKYDTPSAYDFQIFMGAEKEDGTENAIFLLDNLKLVRFNSSK